MLRTFAVFCGALIAGSSAQAAFTPFIGRAVDYEQTGASTFVERSAHYYYRLLESIEGEFDEVIVTDPGGTVWRLGRLGSNLFSSGIFSFRSLADMNLSSPFGNYAFTARVTGTPTLEGSILTYASDLYPPIPAVSPATFNGLKNYDVSQPFTFQFDSAPIPSGGSADTQFYLRQGNSLVAFQSDLPGGTLLPSTDYQVFLIYGAAFQNFRFESSSILSFRTLPSGGTPEVP